MGSDVLWTHWRHKGCLLRFLAPNTAHPHPFAMRNPVVSIFPDGSSQLAAKTRLCNKYNPAEGCRRRPASLLLTTRVLWNKWSPEVMVMIEKCSNLGAAASVGASATAKISIDASLAGAVIGKGVVNAKHICRMTGTNTSQILSGRTLNTRTQSVRVDVSSAMGRLLKNATMASPPPARNLKTALCKLQQGTFTLGERCKPAYAANLLHKLGCAVSGFKLVGFV